MEIAELNALYNEAESCDSDLFAEQRSNVLLVSGNHYSRRTRDIFSRFRSTDAVSKEQKIRLTKNHIHKICRSYVNNILTHAPSASIGPRNPSEHTDQKSAELNNSVWEYLKDKANFKEIMRQVAHDYIDIGEGILKIFFDPNAGDFLGYEPVINAMGEIEHDENGPKTIPTFSGKVEFERIIGFNLLRSSAAKSFEESEYLIYRKMKRIKDLKEQFKGDEEKLSLLNEAGKTTYQVFDSNTGNYSDGKDQVMIREYYFRPCVKYPIGYYYITTESGILYEGELPEGVFPIIYVGFDSAATYARSFSIIKQLRPYQAEINRCASKIAETHVTVGDDKVILLNGTTMSPGGTAHGIKSVKVTGQQPTVIQGRNGAQFFDYMQQQITEMYSVANIIEDSLEKVSNLDAHALLYRSIREKKKFSIYAEKWESFYIKVVKTGLEVAKLYLPTESAIPYFGRNELINIEEWKNTEPLTYQIKIEPSAEDFETKLGRHLSINHLIQYAGQNMPQNDLGKMIRTMPYLNKEEYFSDLTLNYDNVKNDFLQMDRGKYIPADKDDQHDYYIEKIKHRMKQADFDFLPPEIRQNYEKKKQEHYQLFIQQEQQKAAAQSGFIPSGGYLVACDIYIPDSRDPTKIPKRARIPFEAITWLLKKLESQGTTQETLQQLPDSAVAEMAEMGLGQNMPVAQTGQIYQDRSEQLPSQQTLTQSTMGRAAQGVYS